MAINSKQWRDLIIIPTLDYLELNSRSAQNLLLGTCAQETLMGTYLKQIGGPALGPYGFESATHKDITQRYLYLPEKDELRRKVQRMVSQINQYGNADSELIFNLRYATAICRIKYLMSAAPLPQADDIYALGAYWKTWYNTAKGKGHIEQFVENYKKYVGDD